jgi:hypothetical protein
MCAGGRVGYCRVEAGRSRVPLPIARDVAGTARVKGEVGARCLRGLRIAPRSPRSGWCDPPRKSLARQPAVRRLSVGCLAALAPRFLLLRSGAALAAVATISALFASALRGAGRVGDPRCALLRHALVLQGLVLLLVLHVCRPASRHADLPSSPTPEPPGALVSHTPAPSARHAASRPRSWRCDMSPRPLGRVTPPITWWRAFKPVFDTGSVLTPDQLLSSAPHTEAERLAMEGGRIDEAVEALREMGRRP